MNPLDSPLVAKLPVRAQANPCSNSVKRTKLRLNRQRRTERRRKYENPQSENPGSQHLPSCLVPLHELYTIVSIDSQAEGLLAPHSKFIGHAHLGVTSRREDIPISGSARGAGCLLRSSHLRKRLRIGAGHIESSARSRRGIPFFRFFAARDRYRSAIASSMTNRGARKKLEVPPKGM